MEHWNNKTITINDMWGIGAAHVLKTQVEKRPQFSLRTSYLSDKDGREYLTHFTIDFKLGFLAEGWRGVTLNPGGRNPITGISALPPWDSSQKSVYINAIENVAGILGDARTARLEGIVPYVSQGQVHYDRVRLFYAANAIRCEETPDLVIIKVATYQVAPGTVRALQDGGGHGVSTATV